MSSPRVALTIAGSDSSAGAGLQADLKCFAAHQVYGLSALTAILAEAPGSVRQVQAVSEELLSAQLESIAQTFSLSSIKTGMLANEGLVDVVAAFLHAHPEIPVVVDPVIRASAGAELLSPRGLARLCEAILPRATLLTPNLPEAEQLLGRSLRSGEVLAEAARQLWERYGCNVLLKAGHLADPSAIICDYACLQGELVEFSRPRLEVPDVHGTGCTLSAAIAAHLARGQALNEAVAGGTRYLAACLAQHFAWPSPGGPGGRIEALNHFPDGVECARS